MHKFSLGLFRSKLLNLHQVCCTIDLGGIIMNYTKMLYKYIGTRIKNLRKETTIRDYNNNPVKATLDNIEIDNAMLSRIQNGIASKRKNPYLINVTQMKILAELFNLSIEDLIWGDYKERESFIKVTLLAIMINGKEYKKGSIINPFIYFDSSNELYQWVLTQSFFPETVLPSCRFYLTNNNKIEWNRVKGIIPQDALRIKIEKILSEKYPFFSNKEYYELYDLIASDHDDELSHCADILIKMLLRDFSFTKSFTRKATNKILNESDENLANIFCFEPVEIKTNTEQLLLHPSTFILEAMDYKQYDYCLFMDAFEKLWKIHKTRFMNFFNNNIFKKPILLEKGLKAFQNKDFDVLYKSQDFDDLLSFTSVYDNYINAESLLANNYFTLSVQFALQEKAIQSFPDYNSKLLKLLSSQILATDKTASSFLNKKTSEDHVVFIT